MLSVPPWFLSVPSQPGKWFSPRAALVFAQHTHRLDERSASRRDHGGGGGDDDNERNHPGQGRRVRRRHAVQHRRQAPCEQQRQQQATRAPDTDHTQRVSDQPLNDRVPKGAKDGTKLRLRGKGLSRGKAGERGDQFVEIHIVPPEGADDALAAFMAEWEKAHPQNPRRKGAA